MDVTDMGVSNPINAGSETVTPTLQVKNKCGEFKSHTALTQMGISHPNKHVHINDGEPLLHMAPIEVNLINLTINNVHNNCGEFKSHMAQTNMGISLPINASLATATPTNHGNITDGDLLHHTAPREGNLVSVPIIYVKEKEPSLGYVVEKPKKKKKKKTITRNKCTPQA